MIKTLSFYVILLLMTLVFIEGAGRLAYRVLHKEPFTVLEPAISEQAIPQAARPPWMEQQIQHPYTGASLTHLHHVEKTQEHF